MKEKKAKKAKTDNPENLPSAPHNTLFGTKKEPKKAPPSPAATSPEQQKGKKRPRPEVLKEDPAAAKLRAEKKRRKTEGAPSPKKSPGSKESNKPPAPGTQKAAKPHAALVEQTNRLWEKLRSDKTEGAERARLIDEVLTLFGGKVTSLLQKHDSARVLQSVFKHGSAAQRDALMKELSGSLREIAKSHYGHFLLISILRHGGGAHKQLLVKELLPHAADLVSHSEGSAVLQILYSDVASTDEKNAMYRHLWGKEMALFHDNSSLATLADLFEKDSLAKDRVLRQLDKTLQKATRKGLALTSLVQRGGAELLEHADEVQRVELVSTFKEHAVHIMHTKDGCKIAVGCVRHGDAKDRKGLLKALKGYAPKAALDPHGTLMLCAAMDSVDDTVLLSKGPLAELIADLPTLATHPHGALPFMMLLAPRSTKYFNPEQLSILGGASSSSSSSSSKKDPAVRRTELLTTLLPPLVEFCTANAARLAAHPHGAHLLYEAARVAGGLDEAVAEAAKGLSTAALFEALAASASSPPPEGAAAAGGEDEDDEDDEDGGEADGEALVTHAYGARCIKRLAKEHRAFAEALLPQLAGELLNWAKRGAGWVVLALLESKGTEKAVKAELKGGAKALAKSSAAGCRSLCEALKK